MQMRQLVNGPEARKGKATGIQGERARETDRESFFLPTNTHSLLSLFSLYVLLNFYLSFWITHGLLRRASEWHTCPSLCCYNRQWFALAALLSFSILIEWRACEREGRRVWLHCPESSPHFTQLRDTASIPSLPIPIQQDRLDKDSGWTCRAGGRQREEDEEGGMDGVATRQQGEKRGKVVGVVRSKRG